jgi:hypothetical protein
MKSKMTLVCGALISSALLTFGQPYYVSPAGDDQNPGTQRKPFATLQRAQQAVRKRAM